MPSSACKKKTNDHRVTLSPRHLVIAFFTLVLAFNTCLTMRDYFTDWPRGDYVRFWQQATWTQAVRALDEDPSRSQVAASGLSINDFDPQTFDLLGVRADVKVKWFDCRNAILFPHDQSIRYLIPSFFPCDAGMWSLYVRDARLIYQPTWPDTREAEFALYEFERPRSFDVWQAGRAVFPPVFIGDEHFEVGAPMQPIETW